MRASNEGWQRFHNRGEGPYYILGLSHLRHYQLLRHYAKKQALLTHSKWT